MKSHGHTSQRTQSPTYRTWYSMKRRCLNSACEKYPDYGGRGIKVCERWLSFENFYADMGDRPAGCTLDRKDNNGDYEPGNCRWATPREQRHNRRQRQDALLLEGRGTEYWAKVWGISRQGAYSRIKRATRRAA